MKLLDFIKQQQGLIVRILDKDGNLQYAHKQHSIQDIPLEEGHVHLHQKQYINTLVEHDQQTFLYTTLLSNSINNHLETFISAFENLDVPIAIIHNKEVVYRNPKLSEFPVLPWAHRR